MPAESGFIARIPIDKVENCLKALGLRALLSQYNQWLRDDTERLRTHSTHDYSPFPEYTTLLAWQREAFVVLVFESQRPGINKTARKRARESGVNILADLHDGTPLSEQVRKIREPR